MGRSERLRVVGPDLVVRLQSRCGPRGRNCIVELGSRGESGGGSHGLGRPADTGRAGPSPSQDEISWDVIDALIHQLGSAESPHHPLPPSCTPVRRLSKSADQMRARAAPGAR